MYINPFLYECCSILQINSLYRKKRRYANIIHKQRTILIECMNMHSELLKRRLTSLFTLKDSIFHEMKQLKFLIQ